MARKLKPDDGPATAKHNVRGRQTAIRECSAQMADIKEERKGLNERASDVRERLRNLGIDPKAFDAGFRILGMEDEGQKQYLDSLKEVFDALPIGSQVSLFADDAPAGAPEKPSGADKMRAKADGKDAGLNAKHAGENPHPKGTPLHDPWYKGWMAGQAEIAGRMKGNKAAKAPEPQPAA